MSTRSRIVVENPDQTFDSIYVHSDGYPSYEGAMLLKHYTDPEKIAALLDIGSVSFIAASTECPEGHSFQHPVKGYCVAYGRDRGEKGTEARRNEVELPLEEEYTYLFKNNQWYLMGSPSKGVLLTHEKCAMDTDAIFYGMEEIFHPVSNSKTAKIKRNI